MKNEMIKQINIQDLTDIFVSDFNDALGNLYADSSFSSKISSIEDNQDTVNALMKKLKNPPDEYKDAYDAVSDLYDAYISLTNCATDPSGQFADIFKYISMMLIQIR